MMTTPSRIQPMEALDRVTSVPASWIRRKDELDSQVLKGPSETAISSPPA